MGSRTWGTTSLCFFHHLDFWFLWVYLGWASGVFSLWSPCLSSLLPSCPPPNSLPPQDLDAILVCQARLRSLGLLRLAPSGWPWLSRVSWMEEEKEPSQWKGQRASFLQACLHSRTMRVSRWVAVDSGKRWEESQDLAFKALCHERSSETEMHWERGLPSHSE